MSNGVIIHDLGAHRFKIKPGNDNPLARKRVIFEILALAEVCTL